MSDQLMMEFAMEDKKNHALNLVEDVLSSYFYYDRKDDEDLSVKEMEELINSGTLTVDELIDQFSLKIRQTIAKNF